MKQTTEINSTGEESALAGGRRNGHVQTSRAEELNQRLTETRRSERDSNSNSKQEETNFSTEQIEANLFSAIFQRGRFCVQRVSSNIPFGTLIQHWYNFVVRVVDWMTRCAVAMVKQGMKVKLG